MPGNDVRSKGPSFVLKFGVWRVFPAGLETPRAEYGPGGRELGKWVGDGARLREAARSLRQPLPRVHTHLPGLGLERTHLRPDDLIKRARLGGSVQGKGQEAGALLPRCGLLGLGPVEVWGPGLWE